MSTKGDILRGHYSKLFRKATAWVGVISMLSLAFLAGPAAAASYTQISVRSTTLGTSAPGVSTSYTFTFQVQSTENVEAVAFSICDAPWEINATCSQTAGAAGASLLSATLNTASPTSTQFQTGFSVGTGAQCGTATSAANICIYDATGVSLTANTNYSVQLTGVTNPTSANKEFYTNLFVATSSPTTVYTAPNDFGAMADSTSQTMSVTADVQESLTFCVGATVASGCGTIGAGSVALNPNPMTTAAASDVTAQFDAATNAASGYTVAYNATQMTDTTADTIANYSSSASSPGTAGFGFNLVSDTTPTVGAAASGGSGSCSAYTAYCTANSYSYSTAGGTDIASAAAATTDTVYTISYVGNVSATTKPGAYTATQTYIATGNF